MGATIRIWLAAICLALALVAPAEAFAKGDRDGASDRGEGRRAKREKQKRKKARKDRLRGKGDDKAAHEEMVAHLREVGQVKAQAEPPAAPPKPVKRVETRTRQEDVMSRIKRIGAEIPR